jgi:hypothetical protein
MKRRRIKGSSLVELLAGSIILIPIFLYGIDYASVSYANTFNANVCRDACRAAAAGPPTMFCPLKASDPYRPRKRAEKIITRSSQANAWIKVLPTFKMAEQILPPVPIPAYGGPVNGFVRVQTTVELTPPFLLPMVDKVVHITREEQFPYTWVMPANDDAIVGGGGGPPPTLAPPVIIDSDAM